MGAQPLTEPIPAPAAAPSWRLGTLLAFRFCVIYFGLFALGTQIFTGVVNIPALQDLPVLGALPPMRNVVLWTAAQVFKLGVVPYADTGSGDKAFDWVFAFCVLVLAAASAVVWSIVDRRRTRYRKLYSWFRLFLRLALGSQLLVYGAVKAVPLQMPFPFLARLVEPYGNFSPMGVLWSFVGASPAYEIFAGCAEILAGILIMIPRTAIIGALLALADMTQVFVLNMAYDVPVKLFSFHLLLTSAILLAPHLSRLARFFLLKRPTNPPVEPWLFASHRGDRIAALAQGLIVVLLLAGNAYGSSQYWRLYGGGREKSPLYGIWNVRSLTVQGGAQAPPYSEWRRLIFDFPQTMSVQLRDDSVSQFSAKFDMQTNGLSISAAGQGALFHWQRPSANELTLDGEMNHQRLHIDMELQDRDKLPLLRRGFHWISERPYNR